MFTISTLLQYSVLVSIIIMLPIMFIGLNIAMRRAKWPDTDRRQTLSLVTVILTAWLALALILSWLGVYQATLNSLPTIQYGIVLPLALGVTLLWLSPKTQRILDAIPQSWLIGVQVFRVLGVIFIIFYAAKEMPGLFALPAGIGDMLVGLMAPLVAIAYARNPRTNAGRVLAWNVFGILDLIVAVATGFITSPSPMQMAAFDRPNELIAAFPLNLIPTFLVPLWIVFHIASLRKLQRANRQNSYPGVMAAA